MVAVPVWSGVGNSLVGSSPTISTIISTAISSMVEQLSDTQQTGVRFTHRGPNISWDECREFRITEVPQWRKDMAQAIKDGKAVQYLNGHSDWIDCPHTIEYFLNRNRWLYEIYYRIKPEPKPDVVKFFHVDKKHIVRETGQYYSHLKLIWDGESGALKGTEVLK